MPLNFLHHKKLLYFTKNVVFPNLKHNFFLPNIEMPYWSYFSEKYITPQNSIFAIQNSPLIKDPFLEICRPPQMFITTQNNIIT